ncbi:hypothetical protein C9J21_16300 [Photobacterium phosphoreum]|nr:AAA family ATPase [Photobacterium phosphoreum]PSW31561.1 hypothetical protein C9J21_16300 [Photobacterium phosphoreum]
MFTKVTNLKIKKLFGFANYNIHFSNDDLTIITGPNGYGKTMILNIIKHILLEEYKKLNEMDFSEIEFTTNKEIILIKKNENKLDISSKYYSDLNNYSENIDFNLNLNEIKTRVKVISLMSSGGISGEKIKKQNENFILKLISFKEKTNNFEEFITNSYKTLKTSMYIKEINHSSLIYDRLFGLQETLKKYNKYGIFDNIKEFIELNKSSNIKISEDIISSFNLIELDEIITESFNYLSELQDYLDLSLIHI